jgi:OmpA-OmpF porin, OOP family
MLDIIIREVAAKFGLGDKAGMVVSALLGMMFQKQSGGLAGFLDMFKQKGLASLASTWIGGGSGLPLAINPTQLENVIGSDLMKGIASKTGLPIGPISSALAFMLPKIIHGLTADGKVPADIPASISQYMSGDKAGASATAGSAAIAAATVGAAGKAVVGSAAEKAGAAAAAAGAAGKAAIGGAAGNVAGAAASMAPAAAAAGGGMAKWLWLLVPLIAIGWYMTRKPAEAPAPAPVAEAPKPAPVVEAPKPTEAPKVVEAPAPTAAPVAEAPKDAAAQLDALKAAGNVSGEDLVKALNMTNIRFATGSAQISPESMDIVKKAAETIKAATAGTKIEVGGHTDNVGNATSNMKLSDARAQSVMSALVGLGVGKEMLSAKGYGDSKPVDSNDTAEGKAKNRRMEYSLVK